MDTITCKVCRNEIEENYIPSIKKYTHEIRSDYDLETAKLIILLCDEVDKLRKENMIMDAERCYFHSIIEHCYNIFKPVIDNN